MLACKIRIYTFSLNAKYVYIRFGILASLMRSDGLYWARLPPKISVIVKVKINLRKTSSFGTLSAFEVKF